MKFIPLEAAALEWLRYRHGCHIVMMERGPFHGRPDVIGVTDKNYVFEIEVKRTVSDFRADAKKEHRKYPEIFAKHIRRLWYMVSPDIVERVRSILPPACGLLTVRYERLTRFGMPEPWVIVPAKTRKVEPVTDKMRWRLVRDMAATLAESVCRRSRERWKLKELS